MAQVSPCHQQAGESRDDSRKKGPMLVLDCMGVDLFQHDAQIDIVHAEPASDQPVFTWPVAAIYQDAFTDTGRYVRGPPFEARLFTRPITRDIYLKTLRIRV